MSYSHTDAFLGLPALTEVTIKDVSELEPHFARRKPFVVRGLVSNWPLVQQGLKSGDAARNYLLEKSVNRPFMVTLGPDRANGRVFYDDDMRMNTKMRKVLLSSTFDKISEIENDDVQPLIYMSSLAIETFFSGLHEENNIPIPSDQVMERIWIGTRSRIAAHNDNYENLACVSVGRRRFTLFPPEEYKNLYIGPLENTPAGRPISMVDFHNPDFEKYPNFKLALKAGATATLEPGDAIFIPSNWWHHVEGLDGFNVLINYWWREAPWYLGSPQNVLNHAIMTIRDLPDHEKEHWKSLFDHYVFENDKDVAAHLPEEARGILAPLTAQSAAGIRAYLLKVLQQ